MKRSFWQKERKVTILGLDALRIGSLQINIQHYTALP
jgi:hypothetical protein